MSSLLPLPFHYVLGMYNLLAKQAEEEKKKQTEDQENSPSIPSYGNVSIPKSFSISGPNGTTNMRVG
jgi:hypothetical protein